MGEEELTAFLDYPAGREAPARIRRLFPAIIEEAAGIVDARGIAGRFAPGDAIQLGLEPVEAESLVLGIVTIGPELEARVSALAKRGEVVRGVLLDAAGSAAVEQAADRLSEAVIATSGALCAGDLAALRGGHAGAIPCRWSPGYGSWPLTAQAAIFARLPHDALGVHLLPSMLMQPRKSISFAMWLGGGAEQNGATRGCARCPLDTCRYRKEERTR